MSTDLERRRVYMTPNLAVGILCFLITFVMLYPVAEWYIDCPIDNPNCTMVKEVLWNVVAILSLYHGDGLQFTDSIDERESKNIFPLLTLLIITIYFAKNYEDSMEKIETH